MTGENWRSCRRQRKHKGIAAPPGKSDLPFGPSNSKIPFRRLPNNDHSTFPPVWNAASSQTIVITCNTSPQILEQKRRSTSGPIRLPNLAIEVEVTRKLLNKMGEIYAAFRVPELWR